MKARRKPSAAPKRLRLRAQAEKRLAAAPRDLARMPVADVQKLVHELQVHQIELEMQNEELRRTQQELEAAREQLLLPYDAAPVGFVTLDAQGKIRAANLAAARLLNFDRVKLAGRKLTQFIAPGSQDDFYRSHHRLTGTGEKQTCELHLLRTGGPQFIAQLELVADHDALELAPRCLVMLSDITERKLADAALQESEERQRFALETSRIGAWDLNLADHSATRSPEHDRIFGYAELLPQWTYEMAREHVLPEDRDIFDSKYRHAIETQGDWNFECRIRRADGQIRWIWVAGRHHMDAAGIPRSMGGIVQDITERKQTEETLQFLLRCGTTGSGEGFFKELARYLAGTLDMDFVCIDRLEEGLLAASTLAVFHNGKFEDNVSYTLNDTPCGEVVGRGICSFPRNVRGLFPRDAVLQDLQAESYAGTTLWSSQGKPIGLIAVIGRQPRPDTRQAESILQLVAVRAAGELERQQTEAALRGSEERFRTMANAMPQLAWSANANGWLHWYNRRWYEYTGTTPEQMEGWGWQSVHDPVALPKVLEQWKASIATGEPFEMTFPLRGADGVFRLFLTRGFPLKDAAGRVTQWFGTNTDVTELKRAEEALRQSEERLRLAQESAKVGVWDWQIETGALNFTPELNKLYGLPPGTINTYQDWRERVHPDDLGGVEAGRDEAVAKREPFDLEFRGRHSSGEYRWISTKGGALYNDAGKAVRVFGVNIDITKNKQQAEQLDRLNRTLNALKNSSQAMVRAQKESEYFADVCRIVHDACGYAMVWIGLAGQDAGKTVRPVAHAGFEAGYLETLKLTWADTERGRGPTGTAIRTGKAVKCANMLTDPNFGFWREEAIKRGYAASLALPLLDHGQAFGVITIYSRQPDSISADELGLLSELADDLAHGIITLRLRAAHEQAETALRQSEERLRLFIEHAPAALAMFDHELRYLSTSRRWLSDFGLGARELRGLSHYQVFPEISERWKAVHRRALAGEVVRADEDRFERADGSVQWLQWEVRPWHDLAGEVAGIVVFSEDITVRKRAEEELRVFNRELEQRVAERTAEVRAASRHARNLIETSLDALVTISAEGKITDVNQATVQVTGVPREQLVGSNFSDYFTEPDQASAVYQQVLAEGQVRDYPLTIRHVSGRMTEVLYHATVYRDAAGQVLGVFAAARDVTERIRMEQAHSALLRRLAEAQETERGRISREIHDQLGQELTALKLGLQVINKEKSLSASAQQCLRQVDALANSLMRDMHRLAWELRPAALDDFGLALALERYVAAWSEPAGLPADFHSHGMDSARLPAEMETTLYRVTQEALNNVVRHAQAGRVSVLLERRADRVSLIVEDDGRGFDAAAALKSGRLGLLGMQERATLVGGTLEIESTPGRGTTVFVRIPLPGPASGTEAKSS